MEIGGDNLRFLWSYLNKMGSRTLSRGKSYFKEGRVESCDWDGGAWEA